jgi:hypothetical protein
LLLLAWRLLGFFFSCFFSPAAAAAVCFSLPIITKIVYSISHAGREKLKERKGTIKHHSGTGRISNKFEKGIAAFFISSSSSSLLSGGLVSFTLDRGDLWEIFFCFSNLLWLLLIGLVD